ncbi:MAG: adenylyltransferase/cytidyltransferase family protein [Candidatus Hodarchaeales archaeon]|jgi:cytidyltransferase-like protein
MGGAAGHMNHPFDLSWVNDGSDLLDFFGRAKTYVEREGAASVKIDGVNVSFKVVEQDGVHQFAVDRGSMKEIDVNGITMNRVDQRFPEGHGMRPAIKTLLTILNEALPNIKSELQSLGMWDNPSMFLNTEYVEGTTNVTDYDENFLAIHGLNEFYERTAKSGASKGNVRPGAARPEGVKAPSKEVPYDDKVMASLIKKLNPVAEKYDFKVYGSVPTSKMADIDFSDILKEPLTIKLSDDREITKSLGEWLSEAKNPRYKSIKLHTGKSIHPLHKELYKTILNRTVPLDKLIDDNDLSEAIYGAVFMHGTRMLGNVILRALTSPMGDVMNHEGVVLRDDKLFGSNPVKITGDFILGGMGSNFQNAQALEEEDESDDPVVDAEYPKTIAIVPGAFKPPHAGHLSMVQEYADIADEVVVLISKPLKRGRSLPNGREITAQDSKNIWDLMTSDMSNVNVEISNVASPLTAAYEYVGVDGPLQPNTQVILGSSRKGDDWKRWTGAEKYIKPGVRLLSPKNTAVEPATRSDGTPFSATDMRALLGAAENDPNAVKELEEFVGPDIVFDVLSILDVKAADLEEISAGIAGYSTPLVFGSDNDPEDKKEAKKSNKYIDLSLIDEVMELIMKRGITQ